MAGPLLQRAGGRPAQRYQADGRHQRHADGRRDAGAARHLHGDGAAADRRRAGRPAADQGAEQLNEPKEPLVITINAEGKTYLQNTEIATDQLVPRLQAITNNNPNASIYVRGDRNINYGRVLEVMGLISAAGFTKVSLVAEQPKSDNARQR